MRQTQFSVSPIVSLSDRSDGRKLFSVFLGTCANVFLQSCVCLSLESAPAQYRAVKVTPQPNFSLSEAYVPSLITAPPSYTLLSAVAESRNAE